MKFQSTFPHGERLYRMGSGTTRYCCFNPRSRTGNDRNSYPLVFLFICFNPRSRTGNDDPSFTPSGAQHMFQSTFPHGERRRSAETEIQVKRSFNPRSRTGNDKISSGRIKYTQQFQSTFPHGERQDSQQRAYSN